MRTRRLYTRPHNLAKLHDELLAAIPALRPQVVDSERVAVFALGGKDDRVEIEVNEYVAVDPTLIDAVVQAHDPAVNAPEHPFAAQRRQDIATVRQWAQGDPRIQALLRLIRRRLDLLDEATPAASDPGPSETRPAALRRRAAEFVAANPPPSAGPSYLCDSCVGPSLGTDPGTMTLPDVLAAHGKVPMPPPRPPDAPGNPLPIPDNAVSVAIWHGIVVIDAPFDKLDDYVPAVQAVPEWHRSLLVGLELGNNPGSFNAVEDVLHLPRRTAATTRPPELVLHHLFGHVLSEHNGADLQRWFEAVFWVDDVPLELPDPITFDAQIAAGDLPGAKRRDFAESYRRTLAGEDSPRATWMRRRVFKTEA